MGRYLVSGLCVHKSLNLQTVKRTVKLNDITHCYASKHAEIELEIVNILIQYRSKVFKHMLIYFFIKYNYIKLIASDKKTDFYFLWLINMMKFSLSWIYYLLSDYNFEGIKMYSFGFSYFMRLRANNKRRQGEQIVREGQRYNKN